MVLSTLLATGTVTMAAQNDATATGQDKAFVPLPSDAGAAPSSSGSLMDLGISSAVELGNTMQVKLPENVEIDSTNSEISFDSETNTVSYSNSADGIRLRTSDGSEINAQSLEANIPESIATMKGPLTMYQGDNLLLAESGTYNWKTKVLTATTFRGKLQGIILRGSEIEFVTTEDGRRIARVKNAHITTDDAEKPTAWVGAEHLTLRLEDSISLRGLGVSTAEKDITIPLISGITLSHSLNPKEGYLPIPGSKSYWGAYLLNYYGFLVGNRRVENGIPTADYVVYTQLDWRARRGIAVGFGVEDVAMEKKHKAMTGLSIYYAQDTNPDINPTNIPREPIDKERYRIALQTYHEIYENPVQRSIISVATNLNILSDRYMLRDFFSELSEEDDKPDNTIRIERVSPTTQTMVYTRLAPNDYYTTDARLEGSFYRVRTAIGDTEIAYETRNSFGILKQDIPALQRAAYRAELDNIQDPEMRRYYERLLNDGTFLRFNTTHEFSRAFTLLNFLNITPKVGVGYTGYYGVDQVGTDNRLLGYFGCDVNMKFHRKYDNFAIIPLGMKGLTHLIRPYTTFSATSTSSSDPLVPQIDMWSSTMSGTSINPVPLDLMSYTGIDNWADWTIWRFGVENVFTTSVDGEKRVLLSWNSFIDYNAENSYTPNSFSNFYNIVRVYPTNRFTYSLEVQTPLLEGGDGFTQVNNYLTYQVTRGWELSIGHRYLSGHPVLIDSSQAVIQTNIRLNERYTIAARWNWEIEKNRLPIQEYAIFRHAGPWYVGLTLTLRDNGGKRETAVGICFLLSETGTAAPITF